MPPKKDSAKPLKQDEAKRFEPVERWETDGGSLTADSGRYGAAEKRSDPLSAVASELLNSMPLAIVVSRLNGEILHCNPACERLLGRKADELLGLNWHQILDPQDHPAPPEHGPSPWPDAGQQVVEARAANQFGDPVWIQQTIARWTLGRGKDLVIHTLEDISASKTKALEEIAEKETLALECEHAQFTLECIGDAVISTDTQGRISYMNKVAEQLTGWTREQALGQAFMNVFRVVDSDDRTTAKDPAELALNANGIVQLASNCSLLRADGSELEIEDSAAPIKDASGRSTGAVVVFRDRRYSRATSSKMSYLARHDSLTELGNRIALMEQFDQAIYLTARSGDKLAVLFVDLDNFKIINDVLGHSAGDQMLRRVAEALSGSVRDTDAVFRYGGDEFVVLLREINQAEEAARVASKIYETVIQCMQTDLEKRVSLSVGISLYPDHASTSDELLRAADAAMYAAKALDKSNGNPGHCFFKPELLSTDRPDRRRNRVNVATRSNETG